MSYEITFLGLLLSLLYIGMTGLYPGGIIVPSYLVLFADQPARIAGTLMAALLTLLCFKLASQYLIIFGRRRFVFMVLVGGTKTEIIKEGKERGHSCPRCPCGLESPRSPQK